jgi:hypothetical protein
MGHKPCGPIEAEGWWAYWRVTQGRHPTGGSLWPTNFILSTEDDLLLVKNPVTGFLQYLDSFLYKWQQQCHWSLISHSISCIISIIYYITNYPLISSYNNYYYFFFYWSSRAKSCKSMQTCSVSSAGDVVSSCGSHRLQIITKCLTINPLWLKGKTVSH